jgi:lysophospholipase L1-like esterase
VLQTLLADRYGSHAAVVENAGSPGERVTADGRTRDATVERLRSILRDGSPEVVLLSEGINDLNADGDRPDAAASAIASALHALIQTARESGVRVFLATLTPQRSGACRAYAADAIPVANDQIRRLAASERVPVVDLYAAFGGGPDPYVSIPDGLHPNAMGYAKIAEAFFEAIRSALEISR